MMKPGKLVPMFCAVLRDAVWFSVVAEIPRTAKAQPGTLDPSFNAGLGLGQSLNGWVEEVAFHLDGVFVTGAFSLPAASPMSEDFLGMAWRGCWRAAVWTRSSLPRPGRVPRCI